MQKISCAAQRNFEENPVFLKKRIVILPRCSGVLPITNLNVNPCQPVIKDTIRTKKYNFLLLTVKLKRVFIHGYSFSPNGYGEVEFSQQFLTQQNY